VIASGENVLPLALANPTPTLVIIQLCALLAIPQDFFHWYSFSRVLLSIKPPDENMRGKKGTREGAGK